MSTRATIKIVKKGKDDVWMYHHCDGYPDGVGSELLDFLSHIGDENWNQKYISKTLNDEDSSYEFTSGQHGDEDYAYLIDCDDHTLKCYSVGWDEFEWDEDNIEYIPGQRDDRKVDQMIDVYIKLDSRENVNEFFGRNTHVTKEEYEYLKRCENLTNGIFSIVIDN